MAGVVRRKNDQRDRAAAYSSAALQGSGSSEPNEGTNALWVVLENKITQLLMLKLKMTGKNFSPGILKLLHIRFVENGFKLWYNYVNVNLICGYFFY